MAAENYPAPEDGGDLAPAAEGDGEFDPRIVGGVHQILYRAHRENAKLPIQGPDEDGAFPGSGGRAWGVLSGGVPSVVVDANTMRHEVLRTCRSGRTVLATAANVGALRLYAAYHVIEEVAALAAQPQNVLALSGLDEVMLAGGVGGDAIGNATWSGWSAVEQNLYRVPRLGSPLQFGRRRDLTPSVWNSQAVTDGPDHRVAGKGLVDLPPAVGVAGLAHVPGRPAGPADRLWDRVLDRAL